MSAAPPRPEEPLIPKRRNTELLLSLFAVAVAMFAYANVGLADNGKLPAGMWGVGAGLVVVVLVANGLTRYAAPYADPLFLPLTIFLNGIGLVLIHRLDIYDTEHFQALHKLNPVKYHTPPTGSTTNQLMYTALGIIVMAGFLLFIKDHKVLQRYAYISMVSGLFLVALPAMLPASMSSRNGAKSWVFLPGGVSIQPAEFGKLLLVSFFAAFLMAKRDALRVASRRVLGLNIPRGRDMGPIAVCWVLAMLILVFETDLGVSLMFFGAFVVLLYIATERTSWLVFGVTAFIGGAVFIATTVPHVQARVNNWLHPFTGEICARTAAPGTNCPSDQISQSIYGFATGGIFGKGLDQGRPWLVGFAKNADFILVTVGEELGMVGLFALMMVYTLFVMRGFKTALLIRDNYGKLLAAGLSVTFALQVFITAGGVMRVIPLTGLPMPFLAAGGSALVANWVVVALLIRLSDSARRPLPPAIPLTDDELRAMRLAAAQKMPSNAAPARHAQPAAQTPAGGPPRPHPLAQPGLGQTGLAQSGLDQTGLDTPSGSEEPAPPGASDPTEPMPVRRVAAAGAGADDVTQAVPSQPRGYGEQTMLRAAEATQAMQATSGPRAEPEQGATESYTPAFEDEDDDDVRTRPTPAPGANPGEVPGRPGPTERRYGP
ncbi:cell cycle protein [Catenulispora acidiphila DSM 44928]|uniref:Cell cycle protein n=1 Tax=Catenulispora acidiphila (strain DSM 44928 / JCM 14897 / NBRC 102108 / NRRL B-24433 / ID139908) TaxID=479433 RepID=C7QFQ2_CATAD|nr:FtsW/RodA/SpoVE family cell cycle protein [Catenulispora acidiphila]ACU68991.1 cell cycle protein [Catenulispora acidiphila DSM 44928]